MDWREDREVRVCIWDTGLGHGAPRTWVRGAETVIAVREAPALLEEVEVGRGYDQRSRAGGVVNRRDGSVLHLVGPSCPSREEFERTQSELSTHAVFSEDTEHGAVPVNTSYR